MPDALIHLRVSAATKAAWVRESRAAGMRLGDWIIERVEAHRMQQITLAAIPAEAQLEGSHGGGLSHAPGTA